MTLYTELAPLMAMTARAKAKDLFLFSFNYPSLPSRSGNVYLLFGQHVRRISFASLLRKNISLGNSA